MARCFVGGSPRFHFRSPSFECIFLCDLFLIIKNTDFASYADDNTPYTTGEIRCYWYIHRTIIVRIIVPWYIRGNGKCYT